MCIKLSISDRLPQLPATRQAARGPQWPPKGGLPMFPPVPGWFSMLKWIHEQREAEDDEQHLGEHQQSWKEPILASKTRKWVRKGACKGWRTAGWSTFLDENQELWRISELNIRQCPAIMNMTVPCNTGRNPALVSAGRVLDSIYRGRGSKCTATQTCGKDNQRAGKHTLWRKAENCWDQLA